MKRLLVGALLVAGMVGGAYAEDDMSIQLDDTFVKAKTWLSQQNLTLTGSPSGRDDNAAFSQENILFYGEAVASANPNLSQAQREMGAKRAAVVTAQRAVAEYLNGFALVGDTLVKDGVLESDLIRSAVTGTVKGVQIVVQEYSKEKETAVAIVKVGMHGPKGFASSMYEKMFKDPELKSSLTEVDGKPAPKFKAKVERLPESYDGLIVDATEQNFRPALINRIFSAKNELLYDPSKVSQKVLVEQGCGEYTNSVEKAKAALEARGIKNPLVVKASGTVSAADLQVTDEDAVTIFSANQKGNFLAGAKVAFVLK
ncbi:conserved exported protein of unknown function [Geoanaerobacter pelophilus]|uniref:LPP20 lipoprotein n=1 Tax=Geoanaerobacter pelophilus TaxID=60036 RepID=A0ABQ0MFE2_9BACT|nr:hypothetical protein [Geoanaerobacter pelophilus]GAW65792.1 conserved exported protein of unknown function [Geoanaerobacter pelophilus]